MDPRYLNLPHQFCQSIIVGQKKLVKKKFYENNFGSENNFLEMIFGQKNRKTRKSLPNP